MIRLLINSFIHKNFERNKELVKCSKINKDMENIDELINLDGYPDFNEFKYEINKRTNEYEINIIANADIFFDESIKLSYIHLDKNEVYALTRYEKIENEYKLMRDKNNMCLRVDSQDVWIFRGKIKEEFNFSYKMGVRGVDNALAYHLKKIGYKVKNPSLDIRCYHMHESDVRDYDGTSPAVPPPYLTLRPEKI